MKFSPRNKTSDTGTTGTDLTTTVGAIAPTADSGVPTGNTVLAKINRQIVGTQGKPALDPVRNSEKFGKAGKLATGQLGTNAPKKRAILCLDATGSMGELIANAKRAIVEIIRRTREQVGEVRIEIAIYRDYCDQKILEVSGNGDPESFLTRVTTYGGGDRCEAIEAALAYAREQGFGVVLVCGDAEHHSREELPLGAQYAPDVAREIAADGGVVHTFLMKGSPEEIKAAEGFAEIACAGGGVTGLMDVAKTDLIDMAVAAIVDAVGGKGALISYADKYPSGSEHALMFTQKLLTRL